MPEIERLPPRTHNAPPEPIASVETLQERLTIIAAKLKVRATELQDTAGKMVVTDADSAGRATALAKMIKAFVKDTDETREVEKKRPLDECRLIDDTFRSLWSPLVGTDVKKVAPGTPLAKLLAAIDDELDRQAAAAQAEKKRLDDIAAEQRRIADQAERDRQAAIDKAAQEKAESEKRIAEAAKAAEGDDPAAQEEALRVKADEEAKQRRLDTETQRVVVAADVSQGAAEAKIDTAERQITRASAPVAVEAYGATARRGSEWKAEIVDINKALRHCFKLDRAAIVAAVEGVIGRQMRAGVRTIEGVEYKQVPKTSIR